MAKRRGASRPYFRLLPTVLLTLAILGLPTAVYAWGRSSPSFTIEKVVVTGAELVPERDLQRLLRKDYLGRNLFTVTNDDVRGTLRPLSYIASAAVDRDFPNTLHVRIEEHQPAAYVYGAGRWYVVADDAYVIVALKTAGQGSAPSGKKGGEAQSGSGKSATSAGGASPAASATSAGGEAKGSPDTTSGGAGERSVDDAEDLAMLHTGPLEATLRLPRLMAGGDVQAGRTLEDPAARVAVMVIAGLDKPLRKRLEVAVVSRGQIKLHFAGALLAVWGDGERCLAKSMALRAVLKHYEDRDVRCTFIDVSVPDRVLARPVLR